jgi:hypothetical protein
VAEGVVAAIVPDGFICRTEKERMLCQKGSGGTTPPPLCTMGVAHANVPPHTNTATYFPESHSPKVFYEPFSRACTDKTSLPREPPSTSAL